MSEKRRNAYKKGLLESISESRRQRKSRAEGIRKEKRNHMFILKRKKYSDSANETQPAEETEMHQQCWSPDAAVVAIEELRAALGSPGTSPDYLLGLLQALRKQLSLEDAPIALLAHDCTQILIQLLDHPHDQIKLEVSWCLTNIASGESVFTQMVLEAAPYFIAFLSSPSKDLQEQACWALGNMAGDSPEIRAVLHANGAPLPLTTLLAQCGQQGGSLARVAAWALSNLVRGEGTPVFAVFESGLAPILVQLLLHEDEALVVEIAWTLTFLTTREEAEVEILLGFGLAECLVSALLRSCCKDPLCTPVLRAIGNLLSGPESWVDQVLQQPSFLETLLGLLTHTEQRILTKEAAWAASNLAAARKHRESLVSAGLLLALVQLLQSDQHDFQREACFGVFNIVSDNMFLNEVLDLGVLPVFIKLLKVPDNHTIRCALMFLTLVLQNIKDGPRLVESLGGLEAIDEIHYNSTADAEIAAYAGNLVDDFYGEDYDDSNSEMIIKAVNTTQNHQDTPSMAGSGRGKAMTQPAWMKSI